ncbi:MAG: MBL fold metallo-hydrolase [Candidatus Aminicenantes bacterium]|nr:MBL fold metallo-hydrolase [Candidatus Aminicenantes bacterium]
MRCANDKIVDRPFKLTVVYDNNPYDSALKTDWGFSCLVEGAEKKILFDTGSNGDTLLSNMGQLGLNPQDIEIVVLSHFHKDHTGGLSSLLGQNPNITVYCPHFFPEKFKKAINTSGASYKDVQSHQKIREHVYTSGVIKGWINEQSLILESHKGLVLITGCAHPRIVNIISRVRQMTGQDIYMALGGFHLTGFETGEINEIIHSFKEQGVKKVGPSHCSGKDARNLFQNAFGNDYIPIGVGKRIRVS